jgi:16S rRNA (adenine1518-N6/adenine1519-N6)-dimethyltransferase
VASLLPEGHKAKVVANLPYHLTSPIIEKLIVQRDLFSSLTLMVQHEVAMRYTAVPRSKAYSSFTVFLQVYADVRCAFIVHRGSFYPQPDVDSAVVTFTLKAPPAISSLPAFFMLTRSAFEQRRKMMRSSLRKLYPAARVEEELQKLNCSPLARPEELSLSQFIQLFEQLSL